MQPIRPSTSASLEHAPKLDLEHLGVDVPLSNIPEALAKIETAISENNEGILANFQALDPNAQILAFQPIVEQLNTFLKSPQLEARIADNFFFQQYTNLIKNQLLHIQLTHEIQTADSLSTMYPHEMPFKHDGRFPGYATRQVLENVRTYLRCLNGEQVETTHDFSGTRFHLARQVLAVDLTGEGLTTFLKGIHSQIDKYDQDKSSVESLRKSASESTHEYLARLQSELEHSPELAAILLQLKITQLKKVELPTLKAMTRFPMDTYDRFAERVKSEGLNASFPEFHPVLEQLYVSLTASPRAEQAIRQEPQLAVMHERVLEELSAIFGQGKFPYRASLDAVVHCSEFFDMAERILSPERANPLHYAKRYEYYAHYILGMAPKHFTIPSSISLSTYSLLQVGGAPLGLGGVADTNLWVDSYLQSPNEFLLHDVANHERRRYQFTVNYATWLGVQEQDIPAFFRKLDTYNQTTLLPMIQRISNDDIAAIDVESSAEQIIEHFAALTPGAQYFKAEISELNQRIHSLAGQSDLIEQELKRTQTQINDRKKLFDMILFEVVHEDALPPARLAIIESILRPPNLPMPRDFIDIDNKRAIHSMENAGSTISYIIHKLNGSFYDTPDQRLQTIASDEYRSPRKIVESTVALIENLGGYRGMSAEQLLENVVYLAMTDEGFMSYLVEEFQRDLNPYQRSLMNSLKYAESLELLGTVGKFDDQSEEFLYYLARLRERIGLARPLNSNSSEAEVAAMDSLLKAGDDARFPAFEILQSKYYRLAASKTEELFAEVNMVQRRLDHLSVFSLEDLHRQREFFLQARHQLLKESQQTAGELEALEANGYTIKDIDYALELKREELSFDRTIKQNAHMWAQVASEDLDRDALISSFALTLHDQTWLKFYRLRNGEKARFKEVPADIFEEGTSAQEMKVALERLGYSGFRITPDNVLEQNINVPARKIVPELHQRLSFKAAESYIDIILNVHASGMPLTRENIETFAGDFHLAWMKNNTWQLERIFPKLGLTLTGRSLEEIIRTVDNLEEEQWNSLSVSEVEKLRQFLPVNKIGVLDKKRNLTVMMSAISETLRIGITSGLVATKAPEWQLFKARERTEAFLEDFTAHMHDQVWLPGFRAKNGMIEKWIDLPAVVFHQGETPQESLMRLTHEGYKHLRLDPASSRVQQNTNIHSQQLHPELFQRQNLGIANRYLAILDDAVTHESLSSGTINSLAESIHRAFLEENRWHLRSSFRRLLGKNSEEMSLEEIFSAISKLDKNAWLSLTANEVEKFRQFVPTAQLDWQYHRTNVFMIEALLDFASNYHAGDGSPRGSAN